mmetsp:Transcript_126736/g.370382  ORF Transcript_126736/g.370382 Transcript_126736/m.370382 type:complete len:206 (-) Transcript_126736:1685-2302(-)
MQLLAVDAAVAIAVEGMKGGPADLLLLVLPPVQRRRQELRVVDGARPVHVHLVRHLPDVRRNVRLLHPRDALLQLLEGHLAIAVAVKRDKHLLQLLDLLLLQLLRDDLERGLLEPVLGAEGPHVLQLTSLQRQVHRRGRLVPDPDMLRGLLRGAAVPGLVLQLPPDEVLGVRRDGAPILLMELEGAAAHACQDILVAVSTEWRIA